jgi:hypothetical protein
MFVPFGTNVYCNSSSRERRNLGVYVVFEWNTRVLFRCLRLIFASFLFSINLEVP